MPLVDENLSILQLKKLLQTEEHKLSAIRKKVVTLKKESELKCKTNENGAWVLTDKEVTAIKESFKKLVKRHGKLKFVKFEEVCESRNYFHHSHKDAKDDFNALDVDGDGVISVSDFISFLSNGPSPHGIALQAAVLSGSTYLQSRWAMIANRYPMPYRNDETTTARASITYGNIDKSKPTTGTAKIRNVEEKVHQEFSSELGTDYVNWATKDIVSAMVIANKKDLETVSSRIVLEVEDASQAKGIAELLTNWMEKNIPTRLIDTSHEREPLAILQKAGLLKKSDRERDSDSMGSDSDYDDIEGIYAELDPVRFQSCVRRLIKGGELKVTNKGMEVTNKDTEDGKLAHAITSNLQYDPCEGDTVVFMRATSDDNRIYIDTKALVHGTHRHVLRSAITGLSASANVDICIGGDLYAHVKDIIENDAMITEMLKWGIKLSADAKKAANTVVDLSLLLDRVFRFRLGKQSLLSWLLQDASCHIELRNLIQTSEHVIDFMVEETRNVFQSNSGPKSFKWGDYENDQLDVVADWAKFVVRGVQQRGRLSNELLSRPLKDFIRMTERADKDDIFEPLSSVRVVSARVTADTLELTASFSDNICPFATVPSMRVRDSIKSGEKRKCGIPQEFLNECEERLEQLQDTVKMEELSEAFGPAMDYLETEKGTTGMARKEGLVLFSMLVKQLVKGDRSPLFEMLLGLEEEKSRKREGSLGSDPWDDIDCDRGPPSV